mgnify:CR=1 FL=1
MSATSTDESRQRSPTGLDEWPSPKSAANASASRYASERVRARIVADDVVIHLEPAHRHIAGYPMRPEDPKTSPVVAYRDADVREDAPRGTPRYAPRPRMTTVELDAVESDVGRRTPGDGEKPGRRPGTGIDDGMTFDGMNIDGGGVGDGMTFDDGGGFVAFTNNVRLIETLEDLEGLNIRTEENPAHVAIMRSLGASATPLPWGELITALETGLADGQFNAPVLNTTFNFDAVTDYTTLTGHVYNSASWMVSEDWYQSLPEEYQRVITESAREAIHRRLAGGSSVGSTWVHVTL